MKRLGDVPQEPQSPKKGRRANERGDLLVLFATRMKWPVGRVARYLQSFSIPDLYYLKSICEKGDNFAKVFCGSTKLRPDVPDDF